MPNKWKLKSYKEEKNERCIALKVLRSTTTVCETQTHSIVQRLRSATLLLDTRRICEENSCFRTLASYPPPLSFCVICALLWFTLVPLFILSFHTSWLSLLSVCFDLLITPSKFRGPVSHNYFSRVRKWLFSK